MSQGAKMMRECLSTTTSHMSCVTCHMSCVMCRMLHVTCHMSCVTCHIFIFIFSLFFGISGEAYWWRAYPVQFFYATVRTSQKIQWFPGCGLVLLLLVAFLGKHSCPAPLSLSLQLFIAFILINLLILTRNDFFL